MTGESAPGGAALRSIWHRSRWCWPGQERDLELIRWRDALGAKWIGLQLADGDPCSGLAPLLEARREDRLHPLSSSVGHGRLYQWNRDSRTWLLDTRIPDDPTRFRLWRVGSPGISYGPRADLLACTELLTRLVLAPFDETPTPPAWVHLLRLSHVPLLASMDPSLRLVGHGTT